MSDRLFFPSPPSMVQIARGWDQPPQYIFTEFVIAPGADVDVRCICKFVTIEPEGALFAWNENCCVHATLPGTTITKWDLLDERGLRKYQR